MAILSRVSGQAIGSTRYMALRPEHRGLEIGWTWLAPSWRRTVETKLLLIGRAFEQLGCERVELKTDARNARSRAALEALPARFEGVHRRHMKISHAWRDTAWYSASLRSGHGYVAPFASGWPGTAPLRTGDPRSATSDGSARTPTDAG